MIGYDEFNISEDEKVIKYAREVIWLYEKRS